MNDPITDTRLLLAACVVDFVLHLVNRPHPLIVGGEYPNDKIAEEFKVWAASRQFNVGQMDKQAWDNLWQSGFLK